MSFTAENLWCADAIFDYKMFNNFEFGIILFSTFWKSQLFIFLSSGRNAILPTLAGGGHKNAFTEHILYLTPFQLGLVWRKANTIHKKVVSFEANDVKISRFNWIDIISHVVCFARALPTFVYLSVTCLSSWQFVLYYAPVVEIFPIHLWT